MPPVPPLKSPQLPFVDDSEPTTGEYTAAGPAKPRATQDYVDTLLDKFKRAALLAASLGGLGTGGALLYTHQSTTQHVDTAVNERTAALEVRHEETRRRIEAVEVKVDELRDHQAEAEDAAKARQAELLEAIKGKRR